jgi:D-glycerate 3-kinase
MSGAQPPPKTALDHCLPFILSHFTSHNASPNSKRPLFVGINGVQGCGKTTLVSKLASTLKNDHDIETLVLSLDDLYLTHADQVALGRAHPENPLVQHRGQPGRSSHILLVGGRL